MPFIPIHDDSPRLTIEDPWTTWGLVALTLLVFFFQWTASPRGEIEFIYGFGFIPALLSGQATLPPDLAILPSWLTLVSYQFLHAGGAHLAGNLLYLWVFGDNVEDAMGHGRFLLFYLVCGCLAALVQFATDPGSDIALIGASGAISGVLGAYLVLHPRARVLVPLFLVIPVYLPAWLLLIGWFGFQVYAVAMADPMAQGGTAWWAHIGGFLAGLLLVVLFRRRKVPLFGSRDLPGGITLRDKSRWTRFRERRSKKGPWE